MAVKKKTLRHPDIEPAHPGEFLEEIVIPATGKSKTEIAKLLGVSRQTLYDLTGKKQAVTPEMALRLGKLFGDGPQVWMRMQVEHDLWAASRKSAAMIAKIPTLAPA
jgi:antitoxin HigA-1